MLQTTNYQLNQWEKSDRILMDDFNRDNEKLDSALAAMPLRKLLDITTEQDVTQVDLDLSGLDLTEFQELTLYIHYPDTVTASYYCLRVNGLTSGYTATNGDTSQYMTRTIPNKQFGYSKWGFSIGRKLLCNNYAPATPSEVTTLNIYGTTANGSAMPVTAGTRLLLLGVKA